ncbi:acyl-CoA ligase (AMP-forming), exosortase A system-associated [Erythrobacter litoralis]|uniref:acyl-CoA ligase (AMP-forming), exosortase A system-associated n=1 Tax=Erythrobacter litoralis TaxID=39960 RepID=UPI002434EA65|nr:acyl-CoA ligase (AMP-forming), exosortase A system-associated [Erythrobacter litoralis]MDG6078279.1 acyl-CoA ligase (AMP-forming), exosortase A system-associated [Erythrobacter litoralis]
MDSSLPNPEAFPLDHLTERGKPSDIALILRDRSLTYDDLSRNVGRLASWLTSKGQAGDRVASWAAKGELTCFMPLAAARAGMIHVPINPLLKRAQVAHILRDSGARLIVGTPSRLTLLEADDVPANCELVEEERALGSAREFDKAQLSAVDPNAIAAILYTSGSTGAPKGVVLSHANMWLGAAAVVQYLGLAPSDRTLAVLPLSFDYGQNQILSAFYSGGSAVPFDYLFARDVPKACEKYGITTLAAVPPLWRQLTEVDWPEAAIDCMRRITNSGGALTTDLVHRLQSVFPSTEIYPMYGLTEAFRSTYLPPHLVDSHPTSMGSAIPFAEILVVRDDNSLCQPGEEGELVHCGPLVAKGYWQDEERTAERFKPAPPASRYGGLAVYSGDRVISDEDGLLYFAGRRDAMIKTMGNRISPQEIEAAAVATGFVADAVAFGIPDEEKGQGIVLIVRTLGGRDADEALRGALKRELPGFMQPDAIHWRFEMPINPNGKIDRAALIAEYSL